MTIFQALILGFIEGITEFLPVSSTAHLIVAQKLFGLGVVNQFFTVVVQLGAIAGLIVTERVKLSEIIREMVRSNGQIQKTQGFSLAVATLPILIVGFLVKDQIDVVQNNLNIIAFMSVAVGVLLLIAQRQAGKIPKPNCGIRHIFMMGLFQVVSLIPGTSRSGITAAGGAFQGMSLSQALEYSFLLSIPALLAAGGYEIFKTIGTPIDSALIVPTVIATIVAFISSMIAIEGLRRIVRTVGFTPFVIYRFFFAAMILFIK